MFATICDVLHEPGDLLVLFHLSLMTALRGGNDYFA